MKVCAVTAALVCAGGGAVIGHDAASGGAAPPAASLDHFLCVGELGALCVPAKTTLPDGTTFAVSNPRDRLVCDRIHDGWRRHGKNDVTPTPVTVTNELSAAPVTLLSGRQASMCSVVTNGSHSGFSHDRARAHASTGVTFTCSEVQYPDDASPRFDVPLPLQVGDRLLVKVLDPARLCVPAAPVVAPAVTSGPDSLLCFRARVAFRAQHFFPAVLTLCVPTTAGASAPGGPAPTTTSGATTTTAGPTTTTTTSTTTTTVPGSTTTTTGSTTTTSSTTTSTTAPPATTTTTGPPPCPGILINGICLITV